MDLPEFYRTDLFNHIDECKPIQGGAFVLLTASVGGVAYVERSTQEVRFYAFVGNAHSAEVLPNDRVAVAGSTHPKGNRIEVFDLNQPEKSLFLDSLYSGHGLVWDQGQKLLYALGYSELKAYELVNWNSNTPRLQIQQSWSIPGLGGHDLMPHPKDPNLLLLTGYEDVWTFNKSTAEFKVFSPLSGQKDVKAIDIHPNTNRLVFIQAETSWWSRRVNLRGPDHSITFPGRRLYKARWVY